MKPIPGTPEWVVAQVVASERLSGVELSEGWQAKLLLLARGEVTVDELIGEVWARYAAPGGVTGSTSDLGSEG